jgi:hypothetical protein
MGAKPGSVMDRLSRVHDPRRREGRQYKLAGLLGMLILAAVHGERSLRGMWSWGCARWEQIACILDMWDNAGPPSYGTVWNLVAALDAEGLSKALGAEGCPEAAMSVDGRVLRGGKRAMQPALQVITAVGYQYRTGLAQRDVADQDLVEAAIALLPEIALDGKLVSLDTGLLQRPVVKTIVQKREPTWGRSRAIAANSMAPWAPC